MLDDRNMLALSNLARALSCSGEYSEAEQRIRSALEQQPANPLFLTTLTGILISQGRMVEAASQLERARRAVSQNRYPDPTVTRRLEELDRLLSESRRKVSSSKSGVGYG